MNNAQGFARVKENIGKDLIRTLDKRIEYQAIQLTHPELAKKMKQLDVLLESLLVDCESYDKEINQLIDDQDSNQAYSEWGPRIMRCRFVLGCD